MRYRHGSVRSCFLIAVAFLPTSVSLAQGSRPSLRLVKMYVPASCAPEVTGAAAEFDRRTLRELSYPDLADVCATLGRGDWRRVAVSSSAPPAEIFDAPPLDDLIESELQSIGPAGLAIARARRQVLEILREGSACSAWYASVDPDASAKFASLHFEVDAGGETTAVGQYTYAGLLYREPYVARAQQDVGSGSTITLNAHGAFFVARAPARHTSRNGVPAGPQPPIELHVGDYPGGTLRAQIATLLHEFAHIVGLLPVDYGKPESALLSTRNTEVVRSRCGKQIEAGPNRLILLPMMLADSSGEAVR